MDIFNKKTSFYWYWWLRHDGLAKLLLQLGCHVSGSDVKESLTTNYLKSLGANIMYPKTRRISKKWILLFDLVRLLHQNQKL